MMSKIPSYTWHMSVQVSSFFNFIDCGSERGSFTSIRGISVIVLLDLALSNLLNVLVTFLCQPVINMPHCFKTLYKCSGECQIHPKTHIMLTCYFALKSFVQFNGRGRSYFVLK